MTSQAAIAALRCYEQAPSARGRERALELVVTQLVMGSELELWPAVHAWAEVSHPGAYSSVNERREATRQLLRLVEELLLGQDAVV